MTQHSDTELVTRTLQGDAVAFGELVERYQRAVYAVCLSMLRNVDLAQDFVQETFVKALQHLGGLAVPTRFGNWLRIIAANECRLYLRRQRSTAMPLPPLANPLSHCQTHQVSVEQQQELAQQQDEQERLGTAALQALGRLSETSRQVLTLHYLSDYSLKDIGAFLGVSTAAVKMRLHRARQQLHKEAIRMVEQALTSQRTAFAQKMQLVEATVLFTDLVGTDQLFAAYAPEEALTLLYACLDIMTQSVVNTGGTIENYLGDAVVASWNAPIPMPQHAIQGCLAALAIQEQMAALNNAHQQPGKPPLRARCGLHTGQLFVGVKEQRLQQTYNILGATANIASRLESANKRFGTTILIGAETYQQAREAIEARPAGSLKVHSAYAPMTAYEMLARKGELEPVTAQAVQHYQDGLTHYQARRWEEALPAFTQAVSLNPVDSLAHFYQERCESLLAEPPEVIVL
jgi:RNA polymerase sigma factor (sigma-70 family)